MFNCTFKKKPKNKNELNKRITIVSEVSDDAIKCGCESRVWAELLSKTFESQYEMRLGNTCFRWWQRLSVTSCCRWHFWRYYLGTSVHVWSHFQQEYNFIFIYFFFKKKRISLLQTPLRAKSKSTARRNNEISPLDGTLISEKAGGLAFTPADADWQRALWWRRWRKYQLWGIPHIEIESKLQTASDVKSRGTSRNHQSGSNFGLFFFLSFFFLVKSFSRSSATRLLCWRELLDSTPPSSTAKALGWRLQLDPRLATVVRARCQEKPIP